MSTLNPITSGLDNRSLHPVRARNTSWQYGTTLQKIAAVSLYFFINVAGFIFLPSPLPVAVLAISTVILVTSYMRRARQEEAPLQDDVVVTADRVEEVIRDASPTRPSVPRTSFRVTSGASTLPMYPPRIPPQRDSSTHFFVGSRQSERIASLPDFTLPSRQPPLGHVGVGSRQGGRVELQARPLSSTPEPVQRAPYAPISMPQESARYSPLDRHVAVGSRQTGAQEPVRAQSEARVHVAVGQRDQANHDAVD